MKLPSAIQRNPYGTLMGILILIFYGSSFWEWLWHLPSNSEDGIKNYFTFAYHVLHSHSPFWFDGMNYPYGEHPLFADNQPLISGLLWSIDSIIPLDGIIHQLFPLMSFAFFALGGWLLYKILVTESERKWLSAGFAVAIVLLSPQWLRLSGHFSLANGAVLPLLFYALWKMRRSEWKPWSVTIVLFFSGWIHPYFLAMGTVFAVVYALLEFPAYWKKGKRSIGVKLIAASTLPILLFQFILFLTDPVNDRPAAPYGFMEYRATLRSILLPLEDIFGGPFAETIHGLGEPAYEGGFYIGIVALIGSILTLAYAIRAVRSRWNFETVLIIAAIPVFLLSMGWPFIFETFEGLLEKAGPIRQFRGIGRFAFVFFYATNLAAALWISRRAIISDKLKWVARLSVLIILVEAWGFRSVVKKETSRTTDIFTQTQYKGGDEQYSAILSLPFYHIGSENFRTEINSHIVQRSMALSLSSGIPLTSVQMSRTSLSQSIDQIGLSKYLLAPPDHLSDLENSNWLLLADPKNIGSASQRQLIQHAALIDTIDGFEMHKFSRQEFFGIQEENMRSVEYLKASSDMILDMEGWSHDSTYYFNPLSEGIGPLDGNGKAFNRTEWTRLIPDSSQLRSEHPYELSFWIKADEDRAISTQLWFWEFSDAEEVDFWVKEAGDFTFSFLNGWALCRLEIPATEKSHYFSVILHREGEEMTIKLDDILLRPVDQNVFHPDRTTNINNRYYEPTADSGVED